MAYSNKVVDKFEKTLKDPEAASVGRWKPGDVDFDKVGTGIVGAPACGDVMKLQIKCDEVDGVKKLLMQSSKPMDVVQPLLLVGSSLTCLKEKQ